MWLLYLSASISIPDSAMRSGSMHGTIEVKPSCTTIASSSSSFFSPSYRSSLLLLLLPMAAEVPEKPAAQVPTEEPTGVKSSIEGEEEEEGVAAVVQLKISTQHRCCGPVYV